jgi:hypothetical protein
MTLQTDLQDAITRIQSDSDILHDIAHGGETALITTENGTVKSVAKAVKDITDNISQAGIDLLDAVADAQSAQAGSETARDEAIAASGKVKVSSDDTDTGTLDSKIIAGSNIVLSVQNDGGNETLVIEATVPTIPDATTEAKGIIEKATQAEMTAGTPDKFPDAEIIKNHLANSGYIKTDVFTSSGTWSKPSGCKYIEVICTGAGATTSNGGTSSFGSHCSATGGTVANMGSTGNGGSGGTATGGDINIRGGDGLDGGYARAGAGATGGAGGASYWGRGGANIVYGAGRDGNRVQQGNYPTWYYAQGGGGAGATAIKTILTDNLSATESVTVSGNGVVFVRSYE